MLYRTDIISSEIGNEDGDEYRKKSIIATTILSFALSSILTGIIFLLLGIFKVKFIYILILRLIQYRLHHSLVVPLYFMIIPIVFYAIVYIFGLDWQELREDGWVFDIPLDNTTPWNNFYNYFGKGIIIIISQLFIIFCV